MFWFWVSMILLILFLAAVTMWQFETWRRVRAENKYREKLKEDWGEIEASMRREVALTNGLERRKEEAEEYKRKYIEAVRVQAEMAEKIETLVQTIRSLAAQNGSGAGADEICKEAKGNEQK